jgi:hypothetical protein
MPPALRQPIGRRLRALLGEDKAVASPPPAPTPASPPVAAPAQAPESQRLSNIITHTACTPPGNVATRTAEDLLGSELARGLKPLCFTSEPREGCAIALSLASSVLLANTAEKTLADTDGMRHPRSETHEVRDGMVRLQLRPELSILSKLGECADRKCGCYRLWRPDVRRRFRQSVCRLVGEQGSVTAGAGVRYVTLGGGSLLSDAEILCALTRAGRRIESIVAVDTAYEADHRDSERHSAALTQLAAAFAPAAVYAFTSLDRYLHAVMLEPHTYGEATALVVCDASAITRSAASQAATAVLADGGCLCILSNLGLGVSSEEGAEHGGGSDEDPCRSAALFKKDRNAPRRQYWRAQLREGSSIEAWVRDGWRGGGVQTTKADDVLCRVADEECAEPANERKGRREAAQRWLSVSNVERAQQLSLGLYKVVFEGAATSYKNGREVPQSVRQTVAVRAAPSVGSELVATRRRGDELLVAEERNGWVRLSEHDDEWGWQLAVDVDARRTRPPSSGLCGTTTPAAAGGAAAASREAWMLIDGSELGLGKLLEKQHVAQRATTS